MHASAVSFNVEWDPIAESLPSMLRMLPEMRSLLAFSLFVYTQIGGVLDGVEYNPSLHKVPPVPSVHMRTVFSQVAT